MQLLAAIALICGFSLGPPAAAQVSVQPASDKGVTLTPKRLVASGSAVVGLIGAVKQDATRETAPHAFVKAVHGVRYQVNDVERATTFYTHYLGFTLKHQQLPAFANVALGDAQILLSGPGASGSRPRPGRKLD